MISKPLLKQSMKANKLIWLLVTIATCAMLSAIIIIMGSAGVSKLRDSLTTVFVDNVIHAEIDKNSMNAYYLADTSIQNYNKLQPLGPLFVTPEVQKIKNAYDEKIVSNPDKDAVINEVIAEYEPDERLAGILQSLGLTQEQLKTNLRVILHDYAYTTVEEHKTESYMTKHVLAIVISEQVYQQAVGEDGTGDVEQATYAKQLSYTSLLAYIDSGAGATTNEVEVFVYEYVPSTIATQLHAIFTDGGYNYSEEYILNRANKAIDNFRAQITYKNIDMSKPENKAEVDAVIQELSQSVFDSLPEDVVTSLQEISNMDIYGLVVGSIFFRMAGLLLPFVFIIMVSNNLMAGQVDSGSMAYVLSTPTKRRKVAFTQAVYLVMSLFAMFLLTTIVSVIAINSVGGNGVSISTGQIMLFNLGAFLTTFAVSGICFLASACFNRSKNAMGVGGGLSMFFLVATILGLFGSEIIPAILRIESMGFFNYLSIISLFDAVSILNGTLTYLWKFAILLVIGVITYIIGIEAFNKKDLPL